MGYKKHNWLRYQRTGDIIEITLRDSSGGRMDSFRCNNKKEFAQKIAPILSGKYGWKFTPEISSEESINSLKEKENKEFLDKDMEW